MTRFSFVLGTGRCGSSVVHELLCRHEDVGFMSNLEDRWPVPPALGRWNGDLLRRLPSGATQKGRLRFAPSEGYRALARDVSPLVVDPMRDLGPEDASPWLCTELGDFFARRAAAQRKPVFLHKFTGWPRAGFLAAVFPSARFLHVVRDGRAVVLSWLQMPWWLGHRGPTNWQFGPLSEEGRITWDRSGRSFPVLAALAWLELIGAYERARQGLGQRWQEVDFDDVAAAPLSTLHRLADDLGLPFSRRYERQVRRIEVRPSPKDPNRALVEALGSTEAARVQSVLEPALSARGYL